MVGKEKSDLEGASGRTGFFYFAGVQAHKQLSEFIRQRYFERLPSRRRANKPTADIARNVTSLIEEKNQLIFTLAERKASEIETLMGWSLESFYQLLMANHITTKQAENRQKTFQESEKAKRSKAHLKK